MISMKLIHSSRSTIYLSFSSVFIFLFFAYSCEKNNPVAGDIPQFDRSESLSFQKTSQDLYSATIKDYTKYNFAISPLSIQMALYMLYNGADGETKEEIGKLLHVMGADLETLNGRVGKLMDYLNSLVVKGHLDVHNALFYDGNRVDLAGGFVKRLKDYFDVYQSDLDFSSGTAVKSINTWVKDKTYGKIQEVIQNISDQEALFLINALYLKADWVSGFDVQATSDRPFVTMNGDEIMIPTMHRTGGVEYLNNDGMLVVRLPLADSALYVYLVMPDQSDHLATVIDSEVVSSIMENTLKFQSSRVMLELPKIETKTHLPLNSALQSLGMKDAFSPQMADLNLMGEATNNLPLYITRVLHDVYLKMDEKGVEGAAVTTIGVGITSMPPSIQINKPFMYLIVDQELGLPLFIGQFTGVDSVE